MKSLFIAGFAALTGVVSFAALEPAAAITVTTTLNDTINIPTTSNGFSIPSSIVLGTTIDFVNSSVANVYRSPWEGTAFDNLPYTSIRSGTAIFNLTGTALNLLWGSPDTWNTLTFYTGANGTGFSASLTGDSLGGSQGLGFHLVQFVTNEAFRSISFSSSQPAFEFANLTATPIPAALPLFGSGLALLAFGRLRRRIAAIRNWMLCGVVA